MLALFVPARANHTSEHIISWLMRPPGFIGFRSWSAAGQKYLSADSCAVRNLSYKVPSVQMPPEAPQGPRSRTLEKWKENGNLQPVGSSYPGRGYPTHLYASIAAGTSVVQL
eukprot:2576620-Rhodomonas_salina.2